jgi:hypothetical protein
MWLRTRFVRVIALALPVILCLASSTLAATVTFRAELKGANVVPANQQPGRGILTATYDTVSRRLTWTGTYSGLSKKITGIHFHSPARPNESAGVVLSIERVSRGAATLSDAQAADLIAGYWYVDIHTRAYPRGEIRGQVMKGN